MQTAELKEYLGMCVDLEKQVYTQDRMVATLKNSISSMNGEKTVYQVPEEEINDQTWGKWFLHSLPFIVIVAIAIYAGIYVMERGGPFMGLMMWGGGAVFAWLDTVFVRFPPSAEEKMQAKKEYDDALVEYCKATDEEENALPGSSGSVHCFRTSLSLCRQQTARRRKICRNFITIILSIRNTVV